MSINYDWYKVPKSSKTDEERLIIYPRIRMNGVTSTAELQQYIQQACTLTEGDVAAVLASLSHFVARELANGKAVQLDGLGTVVPVLGCTETVTPETKLKSTKVRLKSIRFRPDKALMRHMGALRVKQLGLNNPARTQPTNDEVEAVVRAYLAENLFLRRSTLQSLCPLSRTAAITQLRRLCEAGVLVNRGTRQQPVYCLAE